MNLLGFAMVVSWSLVVGLFIVTFVVQAKAIGWLKEKHVAEWDELGRPSFTNSSIRNNLAMFRFLKTRAFRTLNDQELTKRCTALWGFIRVYFVVFGFAMVLAIFFITQNPK